MYIYIYMFFQFHVWFLFVVSCVVCFHFRHLICIILCLCCLVFLSDFFLGTRNRTKWFCCLHLVVFFPFSCLVSNFVFFLFFQSSQKGPPKNRMQQKTQKAKMQKKKRKNQLAQLCAQIVFLFLGGWALKMQILLKNYKYCGFSIF